MRSAITVFDALGNDVTDSVVQSPAPPHPPAVPLEELDTVAYGTGIAARRQRILQTLEVQVWWCTGIASLRRHP